MILANSSPAVAWTIVAGLVTIGAGIIGYLRWRRQDREIPGLIVLAGVGALMLLYGIWGTTYGGTYVYSAYFFALPATALLVAVKGALVASQGGPSQARSTGQAISTEQQRFLDSTASDATRDTLVLHAQELLTAQGPGFHPKDWFFVGFGEVVANDGTVTAYASKSGVKVIEDALTVTRRANGEVSALRIGAELFDKPRPQRFVESFIRRSILSSNPNNESASS